MLYLRSRGMLRAAPLMLGSLAIIGAIAPTSLPLILGDDQQRLRTPTIIGLAAAMCAGPGVARGLSSAEWLGRSRLRQCRAVHLVVLVALAELLSAAVSGTIMPTDIHQEVLANSLGLIGITLLTVALTPLPFWAVTLPVVAASYLIGAHPNGHPHWWAWLLWEPHALLWQELVDGCLFLAGAGAFVLRPGRNSGAEG